MTRTLAALRCSLAAFLVALFLAPRVLAQGAGPPAEPASDSKPAEPEKPEQPSSPPPPPEAEADDLIEELLTEQGQAGADDLSWLYSDTEEYAASGLVGEPIPASALPERGEGSRRTWNPRWQRFALGNYILAGTALALAGGSAAIPTSPGRWSGRNQFDESVRDAIGIDDHDSGQWGRDLSDVLLSVTVSYPLLVDSLAVMHWYRQSPDVAAQMALISVEAIAVAAAIHGVTAGLTSRERPYGRNCGSTIDGRLDDCEEYKRYRSFFSGHATLSFAAAGVACSHHARHDVLGDSVADALACGTAFVSAGVVGTMRVVGDQHYASDVIMGAAVGTLSGLGVPWLFHYGPLAERGNATDTAPKVEVVMVPAPNGVGIAGKF